MMNWGTRSINCYKKVRQVGQGTYGKVYEGIDRDSKRVVALKKIKTNKAKRKGGVPALTLREIRILRTYRHPNLVDMLEVVSSSKAGGRDCDNGSMYIVFEYFELDLSGLLDVKYKFTEAEIKCFIKQLLDALEYLHSESVCHRDIKCSNILISKDHVLKVTDFGLARVMNKKTTGDKKKYTNKVITLWYRPPELLLGETQYDMSVDMWSVGCIFLELMVGMPILQGKTEIEQLKRILELCGLPTQKDWARIKELPNYSMLKTLEKPPETSAEDSPSKTSSRRQQLALKPPPGRLPRYLSDNKIEKTASELAMRFLKLDPVLRVTASQALMSTYLLNAPTPQSLPPMILPRDSLHEWETKQRRKAEKRARANTASSLPQLDTDKKTDENANGGQTKPRRELVPEDEINEKNMYEGAHRRDGVPTGTMIHQGEVRIAIGTCHGQVGIAIETRHGVGEIHHEEMIRHRVDVIRHPVGAIHHRVGAIPLRVGAILLRASETLVELIRLHVGGILLHAGGTLHHVDGILLHVGGTLHHVDGIPLPVGGIPLNVGGIPLHVGGTHHHVGGTHHHVGGTHHHVGGTHHHVDGTHHPAGQIRHHEEKIHHQDTEKTAIDGVMVTGETLARPTDVTPNMGAGIHVRRG
eukprot:CAMPEP_0203763802 /NCGR_PEP_ID=MMETSP0098-20131031/16900_1 /ASSEMBLY_ACC=CAM_ASM_000208 /TAXON_ID=96639 /ORGANISM=" , Strain NY0313808BC1" /LENGTH=639 /DNA_ID=CAMNT_0050659047 /DNA_START=52 /DNA_END=1969 /DNA_ORIENTATION=-